MQTKQDLLGQMRALGACRAAIGWVAAHKSDSAEAIWADCDRVDWMCWLAFQLVPVGDFAFRCADMAVRVYAPEVLRKAGLTEEAHRLVFLPPIVDKRAADAADAAARYAATNAHNADAYAAAAAARYAADAARCAAARYADARYADAAADAAAYASYTDRCYGEKRRQLTELRALWAQIAGACRA